MDEKKIAEAIVQISKQIDILASDFSVPKNVRSAILEAKEKLNESGDYTIRISNAIYSIDNVSNDINLPPHARTSLWNLLNLLESLKE